MRKKQRKLRGWRELEHTELKSIHRGGKNGSFILSALRKTRALLTEGVKNKPNPYLTTMI